LAAASRDHTAPRLTFKLDENMPPDAAAILRERGHEAHTVLDERMAGASDERIAELCARESRCLLTLNLHFANPFAYPPTGGPGIIVLRHPRLRLSAVLRLVRQLADELEQRGPAGELWIVEPGRVRTWSGPGENP
jgi:predicted nuclease of predicted toxin-antitoxin system